MPPWIAQIDIDPIVSLYLDLTNFFGNTDRSQVALQLIDTQPELLSHLSFQYANADAKIFHTSPDFNLISPTTNPDNGLWQGKTNAPCFSALPLSKALKTALSSLAPKHRLSTLIAAIIDDVTVHLPTSAVIPFLTALLEALRLYKAGDINLSKTKILGPVSATLIAQISLLLNPRATPEDFIENPPGLVNVGVPVGTTEFKRQHLDNLLPPTINTLQRLGALSQIDLQQHAYSIQRYCTRGLPTFIARNIPTSICSNFLTTQDRHQVKSIALLASVNGHSAPDLSNRAKTQIAHPLDRSRWTCHPL